jgi:2-polyprenyl-3-methyl-5-hydroxy-6-metoxy-1,4-benzoquinol methylase
MTTTPSYYYEHARPEMLEFIPPHSSTILEVGCGQGSFAKVIKNKMSVEYWGVELSDVAAQEAEKSLDKVLIGDITEQYDKLPDSFFDCIIFNDVLEHMLEPFVALDNLKNKLTPQGRLVISIPNVRYIKNLYHVLVQKDWHYQNEGILDQTHLRFFTKRSMHRSLDENNWRVQSCKGIMPTKFKLLVDVLNFCCLGMIEDTKYMNYAFICSVIK